MGRAVWRSSARAVANSITVLALAFPAAARDTVEGRVVMDDGVGLRIRVVGEGPKTVVVPLAAPLARGRAPRATQGRRVVFYDPRGRGASDPSAAVPIERDVRDLEGLRASLGIETFALVGWGDASLLAARYALDHPERVERLALVGPKAPRRDPYLGESIVASDAALDDTSRRRYAELIDSGLRKRDPAAYAREWASIGFGDPAVFDKVQSTPWDLANEWEENVVARSTAMGGADVAYDWRKDLEEFRVPTLVIRWARDVVPIAGAREWVDSRNGRLLTLPSAANVVERPEEFFRAMNAFLSGGWPAGAEIVGEEKEHDH